MGTKVELKQIRIHSSGGTEDPAITYIRDCYRKLGEIPGFIIRDAQVDLSIDICRSLAADEPLVAEAPTGTGKTLAYLIGALAASYALSTTESPVPIVIATATVGLQTQIMEGDYPLLIKAGIAEPNSAIIAKGRGRYFCASNAQRYLDENIETNQYDIFDSKSNKSVGCYTDINDMLLLWEAQQWTGDIDQWPKSYPKGWEEIAATAETCIGYKCEHYDACPFFKNRKSLAYAKVIIANQDLVLSDLMMNYAQIDPLFPSSKYLVVFDEAHHLPHKAVDVGSAHFDLNKLGEDIPRFGNIYPQLMRYSAIAKALEKLQLSAEMLEHGVLLAGIHVLKQELAKLTFDETNDYTIRFKGQYPKDIWEALKIVLVRANHLQETYMGIIKALKSVNTEFNPDLKKPVGDLLSGCAFANGILKRLVDCLVILTSDNDIVRWATFSEKKVEICASPIDGSSVLRPLLWHSDRSRSALVSATIKDFEGFERFKRQAGLDRPSREVVLEPIFPYHLNTLEVIQTRFTPQYQTRKYFVEELKMLLPSSVNEKEGTLILFPSASMMTEMLPSLRKAFGDKVLAQYDMGFKDLIRTHKQRVDEKRGSILCGLATMAEGLDLPGAYCTHVIICALPFSVPTSPVEKELQERLGREYFKKHCLPEMYVQLIQMIGRLMRRESDRGKVTFFDRRLLKKYMKGVWDSLPPFQKVIINPYADDSGEDG